MFTVNEIRTAFLAFFARHGHQSVPSSSLVPHNDPTLMFVNAGMVQFKNVFTGAEKLAFSRAVSSQKCVRAGGKHNDLDNVGYTARHHTFFEMLGNFSFGDYFKETAIQLAWQFLTEELKIPREKLYVTVYHTDDEAFSLWQRIAGLDASRIIRISSSDNFWSMGDTGPCGPCSEIFYDHGEEIPGGLPGTPEEDGDRFIEIWNLVFMQYEQLENGERIPLPKPSIDTGMGLERIAAVLQHVHDNYDIDLFQHLIHASEAASGVTAEGGALVSHRVIADHLRSSSFLVADGVMPSNEGRGYVLRRIMRRAMRHAHQLGCKEPLMYKLVPALIEQMGKAYPELVRAEKLITETLKQEEERFKETLGRGLKLLDGELEQLKAGDKLPGETAFKLYDTYGFPLDLTKDILRQKGLEVDEDGFAEAMERQRALARAAWAGSGEKATDTVWFEVRDAVGATEFLGYDLHSAQGKVVALVAGGAQQHEAAAGQEVFILTNQTPFYAESGGQMGDQGIITRNGQLVATITDTKKFAGGLHAHVAVLASPVKLGEIVTLEVNEERRAKLRANHSATHLLHAVLRNVLGEHITQKGSLVAEDRLRFDISHNKALTADEIHAIETAINHLIRQNTSVNTVLMSPEQAIAKGAMALFGEKYGDEVRVVSMGQEADATVSVELCGGTHVERTGDIGCFKLISEGAIAAGVRRIEALTGQAAIDYLSGQEQLVQAVASLLKTTAAEVPNRVAALLDERKKLERALSDAKKAALTGGGNSTEEKEEINGVTFLGKVLDDVPPKELRGVAETFKKQLGSGVVALISVVEGKASLVTAVSDDLTARIDAVTLVKAGAEALGGSGGGGKKDMAQAGGPLGDQAHTAIEKIKRAIS